MSCIMCVMVLASFLTFVRLVRNAFSQVASFLVLGLRGCGICRYAVSNLFICFRY